MAYRSIILNSRFETEKFRKFIIKENKNYGCSLIEFSDKENDELVKKFNEIWICSGAFDYRLAVS